MLDRVIAVVGPRLPRSGSTVWLPVLYANLSLATVLLIGVLMDAAGRDLQPGLGIAQAVFLPVIFAVGTARQIAYWHARKREQ